MKKRNLLFLLIAVLSCVVFTLTACNGGGNGGGNETDKHTYYTVTFDSLGGSAVESQRVMDGNPVRRPAAPTRNGFTLRGWYKNAAATDEWHFDTDRVSGDITLYAGWEAVEATEPTASLTYERNNTGYTVTGVGEEVAVRIPAEYNGQPVTAIGSESGITPPFARKAVISVVIPDSVTYIGTNAFHNAGNLASVNIGENSALTTIGNNAFSGTALTSMYIPSGVTEIGDAAFNNVGTLNAITVAAANTFYYSTGSNLIETASGTLIRGSNTSEIPEGVTSIADAAFRQSAIETINIPASVMTIGQYVFDDCAELESITVDADNQAFAARDGILYNKAMSEMLEVPEGIAGEITLPDALTEIPMFAFDGRTELTVIHIPHGALTAIRNFALRGVTATIRYDGTENDWASIVKSSLWGGAALTVVCSDTPEPASEVLVVYFSWSGNTESVAGHLSTMTGGDLTEIIPATPYTTNYNQMLNIAQSEFSADARPAIAETTYNAINIDAYDTVFIGYPIWYSRAPMIISTFFDHYNGLAGKTVYLFDTSASSSGSGAHSRLQGSYGSVNDSYLHLDSEGANAETRVRTWLTELGLLV